MCRAAKRSGAPRELCRRPSSERESERSARIASISLGLGAEDPPVERLGGLLASVQRALEQRGVARGDGCVRWASRARIVEREGPWRHAPCTQAAMLLKGLRNLTAGSSDGKDEKTGALLQDEIMRFEGRFSSRLVTAFAPLVASTDPVVRLRAAEDELRFLSSALDIAVGPAPEVNLLDMVTLVALGRDAMVLRWSIDDHGDIARGVADAFQAALEDIVEIAQRVTSDEVETEIRHVIREWQLDNPNQEDVTSVRLSAYAERRTSSAGTRAASGLFSVVREAAQTADTALLLGERALYAAQRLPFLVRVHARIGASELVADLTRHIDALDAAQMSQNAAARARALGSRLARSTDRLLFKSFVALGGVAIVTATSWLFARLAYHRLTTRR
jgi:hypothetical protein